MTETLGDFEHLVLLALVRLGDDAYGMTVRQEIEARTGRTISLGAVYTTLDRLERKAFIRHRIGQPTAERGGRRKKLYRLEPLGARLLRETSRAYERMTAGLKKRLETL
ncbi:MAG TPA: helix-turn-helix transcriptional regulator [Vicinamibacterales bacterium]|nr:helix-turn-helix transcriptional regulator [Vicinamibacterales bacterium]